MNYVNKLSLVLLSFSVVSLPYYLYWSFDKVRYELITENDQLIAISERIGILAPKWYYLGKTTLSHP